MLPLTRGGSRNLTRNFVIFWKFLPFFDYVEMFQVEMLLQEPRLADLKALHADSLIAT